MIKLTSITKQQEKEIRSYYESWFCNLVSMDEAVDHKEHPDLYNKFEGLLGNSVQVCLDDEDQGIIEQVVESTSSSNSESFFVVTIPDFYQALVVFNSSAKEYLAHLKEEFRLFANDFSNKVVLSSDPNDEDSTCVKTFIEEYLSDPQHPDFDERDDDEVLARLSPEEYEVIRKIREYPTTEVEERDSIYREILCHIHSLLCKSKIL